MIWLSYWALLDFDLNGHSHFISDYVSPQILCREGDLQHGQMIQDPSNGLKMKL